MTGIRVSKIEAAKRQIELSIRLLFRNEDPIGILTLAAAGFRILRDLGEKADAKTHHHLKKILKPEMEGKLWKAFNRPADFLKHAEDAHDGILENIQEEANELSSHLTTPIERHLQPTHPYRLRERICS